MCRMQTIFVTISELLWIVLLTVWFFGFFRNKKTTKLPNPYLQLIANTLLFSSYYFLFNPFFNPVMGRVFLVNVSDFIFAFPIFKIQGD